jgi:gamma-glutamyl:cysteine ligase YbdK (ATP-grasp superfamily)
MRRDREAAEVRIVDMAKRLARIEAIVELAERSARRRRP